MHCQHRGLSKCVVSLIVQVTGKCVGCFSPVLLIYILMLSSTEYDMSVLSSLEVISDEFSQFTLTNSQTLPSCLHYLRCIYFPFLSYFSFQTTA